MIVPEFWAEARRQQRSKGKQITVRRFGWSNDSAEAAQAMAEQRVEAALARILAGEKLLRREPRIAYNGAAGVPIREEVLARIGAEVITRNAYGARCLNSPRLLMADVDAVPEHRALLALALFAVVAAPLLAFTLGRIHDGLLVGLLFVLLLAAAPLARLLRGAWISVRGGPEKICRRRVQNFLVHHPDWHVRLYRSPAGQRLLVTHRTFRSDDPQVGAFFNAVHADPVYVRMCFNQQCFRARLSAKPWRIGIGEHLRPRPGVWPIQPEQRQRRQEWVDQYERVSSGHAACRFETELGSRHVDPVLRAVIELHDRESGALRRDAPLA